jgi:hypothetical protein
MLIKGLEVPLPDGCRFRDKSGLERKRARVRWWESGPITYRKATLVGNGLREQLPDLPVPFELPTFQTTEKPMFVGHYALTGAPELLSPQIACVDLGAGHKGPLCAYRWDGESVLDAARFRCVQT